MGTFWENVRAVRAKLYGHDAFGVERPIAIEQTGALSVSVQDGHSKLLFIPFHLHVGNSFTLTSPTSPGDWEINVSAGHGLAVGDPIATSDDDEWYYGYVVGTNVNAITLDRVINKTWPTGQTFEELTEVMNIDASGARSEYHMYSVPGLDFDLTGMHISIICQTEPDDSMFGDIVGGLAKGISLRKLDGETGVYYNMGTARTNGHMALFTGGEVVYTDKAGGGFYGVRVNASWHNAWNAVIRLYGSHESGVAGTPNNRDELHMIIQDDLSDLLDMRILSIGHVVTP